MLAWPAVFPEVISVPLTEAMELVLLEQVPNEAPAGTALIVDVAPPVPMVEGVRMIPVAVGVAVVGQVEEPGAQVCAAAVTVNVALNAPHVMVALPAVLPAVIVDPLTLAMLALLLEHVPSEAPVGTAPMVEVPPMLTEDGDWVIPVADDELDVPGQAQG